jgi:hypothetical protein
MHEEMSKDPKRLRIEHPWKLADNGYDEVPDYSFMMVVDPETRVGVVVDPASLITKGFMVDPEVPTNLAHLAERVRSETPKKRCLIRLLDYMHSHDRATIGELHKHVHTGYPASEGSVKRNIDDAKLLITEYSIPVRLRISQVGGFVLHRKYTSA